MGKGALVLLLVFGPLLGAGLLGAGLLGCVAWLVAWLCSGRRK